MKKFEVLIFAAFVIHVPFYVAYLFVEKSV
jgi:hypothetical protein